MEWEQALAIVLFAIALGLNIVGYGLIVKGARAAGDPNQSRTVVRGFRRVILAGAFICFGLGLLLHNKYLHWIGAIFLFEEAIETGLMTFVLKKQQKDESS